MRKPMPLISAVLAVALLAGQWLAAAHDSDHGLSASAADACAVCVYAHGAGTGALPSVPFLKLDAAAEAPSAESAAVPVAVSVRLHPIRGPPALLA